jgi:hypothetical protein
MYGMFVMVMFVKVMMHFRHAHAWYKQPDNHMHLQEKEVFPLYRDRFPVQMLSFLRLSRVQDPAELAKISFDRDSVVSQMNEYEVLQLVMGEVQTRSSEYIDNQVCGCSHLIWIYVSTRKLVPGKLHLAVLWCSIHGPSACDWGYSSSGLREEYLECRTCHLLQQSFH